MLAGVTAYGLFQLFKGDWRSAFGYWRGKGPLLCGALALQAVDISFDSFLWLLILREFDIRLDKKIAPLVFVSGYAGLLLPLQLGRFIRSETIARLRLGHLGDAARGELVFFSLTAVAAVAVLAGVAVYAVCPWAAPIASCVVIGVALFSADRVFRLLSKTPLKLPPGFWRRGRLFAVAFLAMFGWLINGTLLYLVAHDLPGDVKLWQALFVGPANLVLGSSTGLPGGIGAVEGLLGVSLTLLHVPSNHLALAVGAFRLVTFWAWIPVGWAAFSLVNRLAARKRPAEAKESEAGHGQ